ncbi:hypothetical protein AALO_G00049190 [Xyrichtys novacula]|uniref:Uncharacterized protein n=1 Tax=Xyrichtys novacula TaxID=13765 RepID=A0AAV1HPM2_XYRNO|nr:hypothetical protein AALO_G00049190 [Xyrichtys novacula]
MQPSSIKGLLAGVQFHLWCLDPSASSLLGNPSIQLLLNGFKKEKPKGQDIRLPFTLPLLHKLIMHLKKGCFGPYSDLLLETVFLTVFYGFLRGGEFTTHTKRFDPSHDLSIADVTVHSHHFSVFLKHSKTDRDRKGTTVLIAQTNSPFCLFPSMTRYLRSRPRASPHKPLFATEKGEPMTKAWFATRLRLLCQSCGLPPDHYMAHSFHIGAATTAAMTALVSTLKAMGRWSSAAHKCYLRPEARDILEAQKTMSNHNLAHRSLTSPC